MEKYNQRNVETNQQHFCGSITEPLRLCEANNKTES